MTYEKGDIKELTLLYDISSILNKSSNIRELLYPVLRMMAKYIGMERGTITILNRNTSEIFIEEAYGMTGDEKAKGIYKVGEGIIGKVVETGMPMIIPKISEEPQFLNKTGSRREIDIDEVSFVCIPIIKENVVLGTMSIDRFKKSDHSFDEDIRLMSVVASMIALALKDRQKEDEEFVRLQEENVRLQSELRTKFSAVNMIGNSQVMQDVYKLMAMVAPTNTTVMITGESGVGKEMVANAIHYNSLRGDKPIVKVNCSALPESLIESELFGHERGAFTGAEKQKKGRFELANGGTIFLDEIGDLPLSTQVKLLRVLQEREIERLGGMETIRIDVRVITATNRDLEKLIKEGKFREDLYYRLHVFPIHMPPLRERKSDIPLLTDHFIDKYNKINGLSVKRISTSAIDMIMSYHWPGNVRELENCIERSSIMSTNGVIYGFHLPPTLQTPEATAATSHGSLEAKLEKVEKEYIQDALKFTRGNIVKAAENLGISERKLGLRINKYDIDPKKYKMKKD